MVSILKEIGKMRETKRRRLAKGFSLLETMVALVVLAVGVLGLAALLYDSLSYMQGSQDDFIAQQKAEEAAEAIFTAKYTANATFAQISNNSGGNPGGLFLHQRRRRRSCFHRLSRTGRKAWHRGRCPGSANKLYTHDRNNEPRERTD
jgi:prepilin-type N-terminal cleavage/methylation domain-containing protein